MVKHIILWQLKDELSAAEKAEIKANIKTGLEGLAGQIPGLVEVHVNINGLPSSNADLMLDTTFTDAAALKGLLHPPTWLWPMARCAPTPRLVSAWILKCNGTCKKNTPAAQLQKLPCRGVYFCVMSRWNA